MSEPRILSRRRVLWLSSLAVFVPLLVLLALQYRWLTDLEEASAIARRATLENYLGTITKEVQYHYWNAAERTLNVPAELLKPEYAHKIGRFFEKKGVEGAAKLFIVDFGAEKGRRLKLFDPKTRILEIAEEVTTPETEAIYVAVVPWSLLHMRGGTIDRTALIVEERDPDYRMILNPITDETSGLVGLAGMIVDQDHFRDKVLQRAVHESLPAFSDKDGMVVTVRDDEGNVVLATEPLDPEDGDGKDEDVRRRFSFLFTDWQIALRGRDSTPAEWARANFAFNVTLSLASGVLLLGGILLVLRTTAREMRLSAMKNDFVSNVSHELRTPLASIRVFGELLRIGRVRSPEKVREYGEYIETESRRLTRLINNILDFSKIESGHKVYERDWAELEEIVASVLETFEVRLRHSGFKIELERPDEPLPRLYVDRDAVRQALSNLLDNAVKYSDGSRLIRVAVARRGNWAVVSVQDRGIGISRQEQAKIFERFHRVGTGLVHDVRGSGLGLSIVQHVVAAHGGRVTVDSELKKGSTFSIHLPIADAAETASEPARSRPPDSAPQLQQSG